MRNRCNNYVKIACQSKEKLFMVSAGYAAFGAVNSIVKDMLVCWYKNENLKDTLKDDLWIMGVAAYVIGSFGFLKTLRDLVAEQEHKSQQDAAVAVTSAPSQVGIFAHPVSIPESKEAQVNIKLSTIPPSNIRW